MTTDSTPTPAEPWRRIDSAPKDRGVRFIGLTDGGRAVTAEPAYCVYENGPEFRGYCEIERGAHRFVQLQAWMPFPASSLATPAAAAEMLKPTNERTATDYALEFAEYLAKDAERLLEAMNAEDELRLRREESDDVPDDDMHDAGADRSEHVRALRNGIYEFRKRRDRATQAQPATHAEVLTERQFAEWLNDRRMHDVSSVFHDIVAHYRAAIATQAAQQPKDLGDAFGPGSTSLRSSDPYRDLPTSEH